MPCRSSHNKYHWSIGIRLIILTRAQDLLLPVVGVRSHIRICAGDFVSIHIEAPSGELHVLGEMPDYLSIYRNQLVAELLVAVVNELSRTQAISRCQSSFSPQGH
jgi:hypothetical protein